MPSLSQITLAALTAASLASAGAAQTYGGAFEVEYVYYHTGAGESFGASASAIGDVNSDGIGDYLVGAPGHDGMGLTNNGAVYLYSGSDGTLLNTLEGSASYENFGMQVMSIPDIDSDGIEDIAVSSLASDGTVTLWSGSTQLLVDTIVAPVDAYDFGCAMAVIGDISGNGKEELLIGAENTQVGGIATGAVYAYDLTTRTSVQSVTGVALGDSFGCAVSAAGDFDGDLVDDYVVSAPGADAGGMTNSGSVFLISGASGTVIRQVDGTRPGLYLGTSVLGLDDVDGDLVPDFAIGSIRDFPGGGGGLFIGSVTMNSGADGSELRRYWGLDVHERFGDHLASAGDLDGDGNMEMMVGAPGDLLGGRVYVYYGGQTAGLLTIMESEGVEDSFGDALCMMGDHDNDGMPSVLVTAPDSDNAALNGGAVYQREFSDCLTASATSISNAAGGTVTYTLDFPEDSTYGAVQQYQVIMSNSGTGPLDLFGTIAPVNDDNLSQDTMDKKYPGALANPFGTLAADGTATFTITVAPNTSGNLVGRTFYLTSAWFELGNGLVLRGFARPVSITVDP